MPHTNIMVRLDVDQTISELTLTEKIALTAGEFLLVFSIREKKKKKKDCILTHSLQELIFGTLHPFTV